jgi:hypothetical protein
MHCNVNTSHWNDSDIAFNLSLSNKRYVSKAALLLHGRAIHIACRYGGVLFVVAYCVIRDLVCSDMTSPIACCLLLAASCFHVNPALVSDY